MDIELEISTEQPDTAQEAGDGQPSVLAQYHNAAYNALYSDLWEYVAEGKIDIKHNYYLSRAPLQIDMMVIKKQPGVVIERVWGEMIRDHGLIEYKSPADTAPDIWVFYKVMGYAYIYAEQNRVDVTKLSATIICHKKPVALFKELEDKKCYEVLHKGNGIYYILNNCCEWAIIQTHKSA